MVRLALFLSGLIVLTARGATVADLAIAGQMRGDAVSVVHRTAAGEDLDLAVAFAGPGKSRAGGFWWDERVRLGIFLQRVSAPGIVFRIVEERGGQLEACLARVERATANDVLLSCQPEKGPAVPNRHYLYDARAKALVKSVAYGPHRPDRAEATAAGARLTGRGLVIEYAAGEFRARRGPEEVAEKPRAKVFGAFRLVLGAESGPVVMAGNKRYRLPQSGYDAFAAARPARVKDGFVRGATQIREFIGPWQLAEGTVWFGRSFYDGEGLSGVGGFGYFDVERRAFRVLTPEAVRAHGSTAILVEADAVWLGLATNGEWGSTGAGLIRYDRKTEAVERFPLRELIGGIVRVGEQIVMATEFGAAVLENGVMRRFVVDERMRVLEARGD